MSLVLKSNSVFTGQSVFAGLSEYKARVYSDGGVIKNESMLLDAFLFMNKNGFSATNIFSAVSPSWGVKVVGGNVTKMYNLFGVAGDMTPQLGTFALKQVGEKFSFIVNGTKTHKFKSAGKLSGYNMGLFLSLIKNPTITADISIPIELYGATDADRGIGFSYIKNSNAFNCNALGNSGQLTGIPYNNNIGGVVSPTSLSAYQNGNVFSTDDTLIPPSVSEFELLMGGCKNLGFAGTEGDYYCGVATKGLSATQAKLMSSFITDFA